MEHLGIASNFVYAGHCSKTNWKTMSLSLGARYVHLKSCLQGSCLSTVVPFFGCAVYKPERSFSWLAGRAGKCQHPPRGFQRKRKETDSVLPPVCSGGPTTVASPPAMQSTETIEKVQNTTKNRLHVRFTFLKRRASVTSAAKVDEWITVAFAIMHLSFTVTR